MVVKTYDLIIDSTETRVYYQDISQAVKGFVKESGVTEGLCTVVSLHTTCSVIFEEKSYDEGLRGYNYLQMDLNQLMDKLIPKNENEGDYYHPGPEHIKVGLEEFKGKISPEAYTMLNTDAHLRASLLGPSESFIIQNAELQLGQVGYIYFIDWDQNRPRKRTCKIQIIGE